ncbi:MAG: periplasmic heavy metal sensor [Terriglobia bacterium]
MNRRAVFYLVLVFVFGVALGGVGAYLADEWDVIDWHRHSRNPGRGVVEWLSGELALTSQQQTQLQAILEETGKQYRQIRNRTRAEHEQVRQAGRERIREILTEEQRAKFEELLQQIDAKRRQRAERRRNKSRPKETR